MHKGAYFRPLARGYLFHKAGFGQLIGVAKVHIDMRPHAGVFAFPHRVGFDQDANGCQLGNARADRQQ